jgi:hypothetical protein
MKGSPTPAKVEEKVFATYMTTGSYRQTAKKCGVPQRTCYDIVARLGGDELAKERLARRALLAEQVWERVEELVPAVALAHLGVEGRSSLGLEAAKALDSLARVLSALEPPTEEGDDELTTINVNVSMRPPREHRTVTIRPTTDIAGKLT